MPIGRLSTQLLLAGLAFTSQNVQAACLAPVAGEPIGGDAEVDANVGQAMFKRVSVPGITDVAAGTNSLVLADFDGDSRTDVLIVQDGKQSTSGGRVAGSIRLLANKGCMNFAEQPLNFSDSGFTPENAGPRPQIANVADFNRDGILDIFISRQRGGPRATKAPNTLLLSQGEAGQYRDVGAAMGLANPEAYNRQSAIGDINGDGWLDLAIGSDMIGHPAVAGIPRHRVYLFRPKGDDFDAGRFEDMSETGMLPDFPGEYVCDMRTDRAGPQILFRDLDNDGDLDILHPYHVDNTQTRPGYPCQAGNLKTGIWLWRNLLKEKGSAVFEKVSGNGLAEEGQSVYDPAAKQYVPLASAIALPYMFHADVDNDGLQDLLAIGPTDWSWTVKTDKTAAKFWSNKGGLKFEAGLKEAGLSALDWTYREWWSFFDVPTEQQITSPDPLCEAYAKNFVPECTTNTPFDYKMYLADALFGDFDNDGDLDLVAADRHETPHALGVLRSVLFLNDGKGIFTPQTTQISGIDRVAIAMESADLNGDGLLDLVFAADPDNSYATTPETRGQAALKPAAYKDSMYLNTGAGKAAKNSWIYMRFIGAGDAALIGARVEAFDPASGKLLGSRQMTGSPSYKSGTDLWAHFGLANRRSVTIKVTPLSGPPRTFDRLNANLRYLLDLNSGEARPLPPH